MSNIKFGCEVYTWFMSEWGKTYDNKLDHMMKIANQAGFTGIAADFRLTDVAIFPAQLDDVRHVVRWVAESAEELGVDSRRIAVFGGSSGGHLALLAALTATPAIAAVVAVFARE